MRHINKLLTVYFALQDGQEFFKLLLTLLENKLRCSKNNVSQHAKMRAALLYISNKRTPSRICFSNSQCLMHLAQSIKSVCLHIRLADGL